ncbi:unnamed protein product [Dicrocoelium dendriticum]|nr:unnamed protein product [Dicrocoelium dendriticum]
MLLAHSELKPNVIATGVLSILIYFLRSCSSESEENFRLWADEFEKAFSELQSITGQEYLQTVYEHSKFTPLDISEEVAFAFLDKAVGRIKKIVDQKMGLVNRIKEAAEIAHKSRTTDNVTACYHRAKAVSLTPTILLPNSTLNCTEKHYLPLEANPLFENQYVSSNNSVAHVPTNVYDLSNALMAVGGWTASLDSVFKENTVLDPTVKWQYFGSSTGFFRFYPGAMWEIQLDEPRLDFFDCRSQPWYLAASSYPKEMIILIDKSGSMKGRSDIISNATAAEILNTLTENDFFNIIMFSDTPKYADPALSENLIPALKYNKDRLIKRFQDFTPNGTASFERALTEAFNLLNKTEVYRPDAKHCNQLLMFITDSVPASYKDIFEKYNPEKNVRVFVFLLGQHSYAEPYVGELACFNRGYAVTIATLADVKENVLKYLNVVARPNALTKHNFTIWTGATVQQFNLKAYSIKIPLSKGYAHTEYTTIPAEIDTMIASKEEDTTMYTSVAVAVYDQTNKAVRLKEGNLLGVAGIDVPLQSFKDTLRGFEQVIQNNRFLVVNMPKLVIRSSLIMTSFLAIVSRQYEHMKNFAPVYGDPTTHFNGTRNYTPESATISPYHFCQFDSNLAATYLMDPLSALREVLTEGKLESFKCDADFIERLYVDAEETKGLYNFWRHAESNELMSKWGVQQAFSFHHSGLIRAYNSTKPSYSNFILDHRLGPEDPLYAETVLTTDYFNSERILVFQPPPNDLFRQYSSQGLDVPISVTQTVYLGSRPVPMAVVGLQVTHQKLRLIFDEITSDCVSEDCQKCGSPHVDCYLINQASLVLVSSGGEKQVGQSLKEINCALVEDLVQRSILTQFYVYNFQGICIDKPRTTHSFGARLRAPLQKLFRLLSQIAHCFILLCISLFESLDPLPIAGQKWGHQSETAGAAKRHGESKFLELNKQEDHLKGPFVAYESSPFHTTSDGLEALPSMLDTSDPDWKRPVQYGGEGDDSLRIPALPPLDIDTESIGAEPKADIASTGSSSSEPELMEAPMDDMFGKMDQDPYEAQLRALTTIEACRRDQGMLVHFGQEPSDTDPDDANETYGTVQNVTIVPGSLLNCVQISVQQRCRSGSATSSFTERHACEAVCEIVRERMPHLISKIDDCKQPLTSCTERYMMHQIVIHGFEAPSTSTDQSNGRVDSQKKAGPSEGTYETTGEYCHECGTRRWWLKRIKGTNLFLLVDHEAPGGSTASCKCACRKRFGFGTQIIDILL